MKRRDMLGLLAAAGAGTAIGTHGAAPEAGPIAIIKLKNDRASHGSS